jgi:hypothetical protein
MTKLEAVDDIRKALLELMMVQDSIADDDEAVRAIQKSYEKLVDRFYHENQDMLAHQQYRAARNDPEYFMQLILLAYHHYKNLRAGAVLH